MAHVEDFGSGVILKFFTTFSYGCENLLWASFTENSPVRVRAKAKTRSARAGLKLPVGRIHRILKNGNYAPRTGEGAAVYMTAVLEYLAAEILELAAKAADDNHRTR